MSHFVSMFLLVIAVALTICFGVAAWHLTDQKDTDITGQISRQSDGWRGLPTR